MAGFDQVRPGQRRFVCSTAHVDARVRRAHGGRVGGQPYRETLDPETPVRELDDGALATGEYALHWRSGVGGESARTDLMTGDRGNSFTQHNSKDVPQFAPNFTVYVLPPDVVCLYSEDRKFFLHGELYCALASAIGEGGRSFRRARSRAGAGFSIRQNPRSPEAAGRPPLCPPGIALLRRRRGRLLGEPRPVAGDRGEKSPEMPRAHSIDRRARAQRSSAPP